MIDETNYFYHNDDLAKSYYYNGVQPIRYGSEKAHPVNEEWFKEVNAKKSISFNNSNKKIINGLKEHLKGYLHSFNVPNASVYLLTSPACVPRVIIKKKFYDKKIVAINSDTFFFDCKKNFLKRKYYSWLASNIDVIISTSEMGLSLAKPLVPKAKHFLVYPFLITKKYLRITPDYNAKRVLSISTATKKKGAAEMVRLKELLGVPITVLGEGSHKSYLQKRGIITTGHVEPSPYFLRGGVYVNLANYEPFGVNVLEAMSAGFAPVVSEGVGCKEAVRKIDKKLVVNSVEEAKLVVEYLFNNPVIHKTLGDKARVIAKSFGAVESKRKFKEVFYG